MRITDTLKADHRLITQYFNLLEKYAEYDYKYAKRSEESMLIAGAGSFFQFIEEFALGYHRDKEDVLYKHMESPGVILNRNPLPVVFSDHSKSVQKISNARAALNNKDIAGLIAAVEHYVVIAMTHMFKEDNILYSMAEDRVSDSSKFKILKKFDQIDQKWDLRSTLDKYNNLYFELQIYYDKKYRQLIKQPTGDMNGRVFPVNSRIGRRLLMV